MERGLDRKVFGGVSLDEAANRTAGYSGDALAGGLKPAPTATAIDNHRFSHATGHNDNRQAHG
jgi:hypothetical protein